LPLKDLTIVSIEPLYQESTAALVFFFIPGRGDFCQCHLSQSVG